MTITPQYPSTDLGSQEATPESEDSHMDSPEEEREESCEPGEVQVTYEDLKEIEDSNMSEPNSKVLGRDQILKVAGVRITRSATASAKQP
ncbi:hypothetical protein FBU30_009643, partial [Linnemannia zychae]